VKKVQKMTLYSIYNRTNAGLEALKHGETQQGVPYVWGGEDPGIGFDCSGLTQWAYLSVGLSIPRTTETQFKVCQLDRGTPLLPGDLLFIPGSDGTEASPGHVMMYHSPGLVLQAPFTGEDVNVGPYDTEVYSFASRPGDLYGVEIQGPPSQVLKANGLERLPSPAAETLALKNGWQVRGWDGKTFPILPLNGVPAGVCKYASISYREKKKNAN
jgi:cell wall-associated NlpC family hydrolase